MNEAGDMTIDRIVEPEAQRLGERGFLAGTAALVVDDQLLCSDVLAVSILPSWVVEEDLAKLFRFVSISP